MGAGRSMLGAALGAVTAAVALRVRAAAAERDQTMLDTLGELPSILADDAARIGEAAREAIGDGRRAAEQARIAFDEQVAGGSRRTKEEHG